MTSPFSSLKKNRHYPMRTGVPNLAKSSSISNSMKVDIPLDLDTSDDNINYMIDEITSNMANENLSKHAASCSQFNTPRSTASTRLSENHELMSLMMAKIGRLERRVKQQEHEIATRINQENILRDKVRLLQKSNEVENNHPSRVKELETKCLLLQQQIYEMETFLADYGLVWVGDYHSDDIDSQDLETVATNYLSSEDGVWNPNDSYMDPHFKVDYDVISANVNELNAIAGTQEPKIHSDKQNKMAVLKRAETVPLVLYKNGIILYSGPFRSFDDPSTRQFIKDIMDGYFPSELEDRYPDGVPLEVSDRREVFFKREPFAKVFHGEGRRLGGCRNQSVLVELAEPSVEDRQPESINEETETNICSDLPGPKLSVDQFLSKIPNSVMKLGKIIHVRSAIKSFMNGETDNPDEANADSGESRTILLQTDSITDMQERIESGRKGLELKEDRPIKGNDERITTLRIKSEDGMLTYIVKMKFSETVGDLEKYLDCARPHLANSYQIVSAFPRKVLSMMNETMADCGLVPNANIRLEKKPDF